MKRPSKEVKEQMLRMHGDGATFQHIARVTGYDRRTVAKYVEEGTARGQKAPEKPRTPVSGDLVPEEESRAQRARQRLWDVLMDPDSPGQAVVGAFRELSESEGWASLAAADLPEAKDEDEIVGRFVDLFRSYDESLQIRIRAAL